MNYKIWLDKNRESLSDYIYAKMYENICLKEGDGEMANSNYDAGWASLGGVLKSVYIVSGSAGVYMTPADEKVYPKKVLFNDKATILFWSDGTKTVSVCKDGDVYNQETGVLNCIAQRYVKQLNKKVGKLLKEARVEGN